MSELKVTGEIKTILELQTGETGDGSQWSNLSFMVTTKEEYPRDVAFTIRKTDLIDKFLQYNKVGDTVEVSFNVSSREWKDAKGETKFFTDLIPWKIWGIRDEGNAVQEDDDDLPI